MNIVKSVSKSALVSAAIVVAAAPSLFAAGDTMVVTPSNLYGWQDASVGGGTVTFVENDAPTGYGTGSIRLSTDDDTASKATYGRAADMQLSDVNDASYWTKQVAASIPEGSASMFFAVDLDNNGSWDTNLVYEPYWQNETNPDPAPVVPGEWQEWDVINGQFWSSRNYPNPEGLSLEAGAGGEPFYTLAQINESYPDAKLMAYGVNVGTYNVGYTIGVDGFTINGKTFNFGTSSTKKAMKDECKNNGWRMMSPAESETTFKNQGECVSYSAKR